MQSTPSLLLDVLTAQGWTISPENTPSCALKSFDTAVGPKDATLYISRSSDDEPALWLYAQYYSEGRNILEPMATQLSLSASACDQAQRFFKFLSSLETRVSQSFAARLFKPT